MYDPTKCLRCYSELRPGTTFCPYCGTRNGEITPIGRTDVVTWTPSAHWKDFKEILMLYGLFMSTSLMTSFVDKIAKSPWVMVSFWVITFAGLIIFSRRSNYGLLNQFSSIRLNTEIILKSILFIICSVLLISAYFKILTFMNFQFLDYTEQFTKNKWPLWSAYILIAVCPAIIEEWAFRGIMYTKLKEYFSVREALFIQGACFSILHLLPTMFISHLIMGLAFGYVREKTSSLIPCILLHFLWNAASL